MDGSGSPFIVEEDRKREITVKFLLHDSIGQTEIIRSSGVSLRKSKLLATLSG